jgi:hypothetical protein
MPTDDLFADIEERAAIKEFDGLIPREQAEAQARHECEVIWCIRNYYPDGQRMKAHFDLCEEKRGKKATDMLRDDVRKAWQAQKVAQDHAEGKHD